MYLGDAKANPKSVNSRATNPLRLFGRITWGSVLAASLLTLTLSLTLSARPSQANELSSKADGFISHTAAQHLKHGWISLIVKLDSELTPEQLAKMKVLDADVYRRLSIIHSVALQVPARNLEAVAALPFVRHLSADLTVNKSDQFTVGSSGADVAMQQYNLTGSGVNVAVLDSGVHFRNDLASTVKGGPSRIVANVAFGSTSVDDFCGHGTHVAALIAGNGADSTGSQCFRTFYGIAREANIINVKVLNTLGQGTVSNVISGVQWCMTNRKKYNIRVINLSLGHVAGESYTTDPLCQAVESAWKAGIVVVCAAGNNGRSQVVAKRNLDNEGYGTNYGSIQSPGNDPCIITVGASKSIDGNRAHDRIATYSGRGPTRLDLVLKPDIIAPGNRVISLNTNNSYLAINFGSTNQIPYATYTTQNAGHLSQDYYCLSGTSMATPVVSGAVVLMLQKDPTLTSDTIKTRLMLSADKWGFPDCSTDPCTFGAGYLNIPAALTCTAVPTRAATSPSLNQDADGNVYIDMDRAIWGFAINGTRAVWGVSGVIDLRAVWGTRAIWGSSANILNASRAVWGTNVWYDRAIWGSDTGSVDLTSTAITGE